MDDVFLLNSDKIELKEENGDFFVYGYISTKDKDLVNDIVTDNCLKSMFNQMKSRPIKFDIEHESFKGETDLERKTAKTKNPIAKVEWFGLDSEGLMTKSRLNQHHQRFEEVKGSIKDEFLDAFSIAFIPTDVTHTKNKGEDIRMLNDVNLLNVAFTGLPINEKARITDVVMKSMDFYDNHNKEGEETMEKKEESKTKEKEAIEVKDFNEKIDKLTKSVESMTERISVLEGKEEETEKKPEEKTDIPKLTDEVKSLRLELEKLKGEPNYKSKESEMKKEIEGKSQEIEVGLPDYI